MYKWFCVFRSALYTREMFGFGTKTHIVLDIREGDTWVEWIEKNSSGDVHSIAHTRIPTGVRGPGLAGSVQLITELKAVLTKYPQLHPSSGIVFLHAPLCERVREVHTKKTQNQVVNQAVLTSILDEASPLSSSVVMTHAYIASYRVNGYLVHDPRGMTAREFSLEYVRTTVSHDVYAQLLQPLQGACGVPLLAADYADTLVRRITRDMHVADARILDIRPDCSESISITRGMYKRSVTIPYGMHALLQTIRDTAEMSDQDIQTSLPLLAAHTLEESVATRVRQGLVSAARKLVEALQNSDAKTPYPVPTLVVTSADIHAWGDVLVAELPYASVVPTSDLVSLAAVVGV